MTESGVQEWQTAIHLIDDREKFVRINHPIGVI